MKLDDVLELYDLISDGNKNLPERNELIKLRKAGLQALTMPIVKEAFDTRRIDQGHCIIPRSNLQNYHRSEQFINESMSKKLQYLNKLRSAVRALEIEYSSSEAWKTSYARTLLSMLDNGLRTEQKDGDFTDMQPAMGSLDYIEEVLAMRYRLDTNSLNSFSEEKLKNVILAKDEGLTYKNINNNFEITKQDIEKHSYETLINKVIAGTTVTAQNPEVERTITITIKDKYVG